MVNWKIIAIIFIVLFSLLLTFNIWGWYLIAEEERLTNECYYDICEEYPEAYYEEDVCFCYDYSMMGKLEVVKTKYMDN
jgi:hypothetical protein